ncbi:homeobox-leucine zipper protein ANTHOCYANINLESS 2-like [Hevea brasiliensis]|uniref:homeobox-leucine zipper protein ANTHOCYANINLESS 2-like n=1 Tax=Hevea brasiliensis TaxID=3981 RepID=UPI0025CED7E3|nr:homeobox-leucine zipper protein ANTHOCYANINLESS 2-like [Hevea brasiliensis]
MHSGGIGHRPPVVTPSIPKSPALSLSLKGNMDTHGDMGLLGEHLDPIIVRRIKEDGYESRSGSDNLEGASGDDQEAGEDQRCRKKKYNRHTPHQIQELEIFFKECPHPDEKQRSELSRRLGLESKQIKFWFQNRRTQMKNQLERQENIILREENEKLRAENELLKQNMTDPICNNCGSPVVPGPVSYEQQQLRIENGRLKDELGRVCALANKFLGRPLSSSFCPIPPFGSNSKLDLSVGRSGYGGICNVETTLPFGLDYGGGITMPLMKPTTSPMLNEVPYDRSMFIDLALAAMDELIKIAQIDSPLWIKSLEGGKDALNYEEYMRTFSPCIGVKPSSFVTEATRETGIVIINSLALVETLMDVNRWVEAFPGLIARASTIDVISSGMGGTKNGALQVMQAEFQVVSPFVPVRQVRFLRFCKQHAEGFGAVVDVSIDANQESSISFPFAACRRFPSGCIMQDMPNGCSKVTWVEHSQYDESAVHQLYRSVLSSGRGFGAHRWLATLQRYCECTSVLMSPTISGDDQTVISISGKKSMAKLAQRMVDNFCSGVCASSLHKWDKLLVGNVSEDIRILTRKNINEPGKPPGIVLSAATSVWLPVMRERLFDFLRDERSRSEWDILSHGGMMQEMVHISKGHCRGNCVSLLRSSAVCPNANESSMIILQETWNDASSSLVVYAPIDIASMALVKNGGDSNYVALLPSGFVILSDDPISQGGANFCNGTLIKRDSDGGDGGGSLLTVGFQILVNNLPTAKLTLESVETVNSLISRTIQRIKQCFD